MPKDDIKRERGHPSQTQTFTETNSVSQQEVNNSYEFNSYIQNLRLRKFVLL